MKTKTVLTFDDKEYCFDTELLVIPTINETTLDVTISQFKRAKGKLLPKPHKTPYKIMGRIEYDNATLRFPYSEALLKLLDKHMKIQMSLDPLDHFVPRKFDTYISTDKEFWNLNACLITYYEVCDINHINVEVCPDYTTHGPVTQSGRVPP